jgi:hypothetical protein
MKNALTNSFWWTKTCLLGILVLSLNASVVFGQMGFNKPGKGNAQLNLRFGAYALLRGGYGLSTSIGFWSKYTRLQPGCNLSVNLVGSKANLGNRDRYLTNWQINTILTPLITFGWGQGLYQEISPFYFGTLGAVYADFRSSITLGSNFVVMPRGLGRNVTTYRNRTQQVVYVGLRGGTKDWDFNLNVYDDFLGTDKGALQGLADNYDRFYTGGGNLQFRTRYMRVKQYADIYTGNFSRDLFDTPDLYFPYDKSSSTEPDRWIGRGRAKRHPRFVSQDPGQKLFNTGRNFTVLELSPEAFGQSVWAANHPTFQLYGGWQGGHNQMTAQNLIHSASRIDKINPRYLSPDTLLDKGWKRERLHWFFPAYEKGRFIIGGGLFLNTVPSLKTAP